MTTTAEDAPPAVAEPATTRPRRVRAFGVRPLTLVVGVVLVALTLTLWGVTRAVHDANERRLLRERVREAGATLSTALPSVQTPLAAAAEVAEATTGNTTSFTRVVSQSVGPNRPFVAAALFDLDAPDPARPTVVDGAPTALVTQPAARITVVLHQAAGTPQLTVVPLLQGATPRLGYAFTTYPSPRYVAYAEANLPKNRTQVTQPGQAFGDLNYAIYLGATARPGDLLVASTGRLPLRGPTAGTTIAFGDTHLRLVMSPKGQLGGGLLVRLPWIILGVGLFITAVAAALTEHLLRSRQAARALAVENEVLYTNQRSVAETIQRSLLPETLPDVPGLAFSVRYVPGVASIDIGGDWYDVIPRDDGSVVLVVGDVSGRGLRAGIVMASLRYSIRAYVAQGDEPETILAKLTRLVNIEDDGCYATVLCGVIEPDHRTLRLASAGHPQPLLVADGTAHFVATDVGVPVGVGVVLPYRCVAIDVPSGATLLAFTDGLVERRGESLDVGLERLRAAALASDGSLDQLVAKVLDDLTEPAARDDTALLGVRWATEGNGRDAARAVSDRRA